MSAHPFVSRVAVLAVLIAIVCSVSGTEAGTTRYLSSSGGDDAARINSTISASSAGDTVYLNAGTFSIASAIQAKTGVAVVGAGKASTTVQYTGGSGNPMVNLAGVSNVEVANLTFNGNGNAAEAVNAWSGSGQYIHDTGIQNLAANAIGIYFSSAVTDSRIVNNQLSNIGVGSQWGAGVRMSWGSSRNQVLGNTVTNAGRGGIFGDNNSTDLVIKNNTVTGSGSGGTGLGIEVWSGCDRALVENNTVDQWLSVDSSSQVAVRNNKVNGGYAGLEFATAGHDNVFSNNTVTGAQIGISVSGGSAAKERTLWAHNSIQSSTRWGAQIQSESSAAVVRQMYFYKNTFQGAVASGSGYGDGFRFNPTYADASQPNGSIQNVTLDSNTIKSNGRYGLVCGDWGPSPHHSNMDDLTVINNSITGNALAAFSGSFGAMPPDSYYGDQLRWQGNTISGNGADNQQTSKGTFFAASNLPSVSINAPSFIIVGKPVQFSLNYSGHDSLANVLWDLGAGLPATTSTATYTYSDPGAVTVGLVAWDSQGRGAHQELSLMSYLPLAGDADRSGTVDFTDLNVVLTNYNKSGDWSKGDFDGNGAVNFADLNAVLTNYNHSVTSSSVSQPSSLDAQAIEALSRAGITAVPEPGAVILLGIGAIGLLAYAWHRCRRERRVLRVLP